MDTKDEKGFNLPGVKLTSDSDDNMYFWVKGNFKISESGSGDWNGDNSFNSKAFKMSWDNGNVNIAWQNGGDSNLGEDVKFVRMHWGDNVVTVQDTPFTGHEGAWGSEPTSYTYIIKYWNDGDGSFDIVPGTPVETYLLYTSASPRDVAESGCGGWEW